MPIPFNGAAAAYASAATRGLNAPAKAGAAGGPSFGDVLESAVNQSIETLHKGEELTAKGVLGKADLTDVVGAVTNAEVTLQAVVNVRDKVISAYQEILRMPI